jgi:hypothetical protein
MALGSTQPLTGMSTRNLPGGKWRPARKADNLTAICEPVLTVYKARWAPRPAWTSWRRETSCPCPESNPSCPPPCPSRYHGHSSDKNGVYHFIFIYHSNSVFNCFIYACLLLPTSPSCNSCHTKRMIFHLQKVLGTGPKENTSRLLLMGRCLATDPTKERITPLLGRSHSNVHKKTDPKENTTSAWNRQTQKSKFFCSPLSSSCFD